MITIPEPEDRTEENGTRCTFLPYNSGAENDLAVRRAGLHDVSIDAGGRVSNKPIKWEYFSDTDRHSLFLFYRLLNNFRKNLPVFSTTNYSWSLSSPVKRLQLTGSEPA